jgi:hypothetical protein
VIVDVIVAVRVIDIVAVAVHVHVHDTVVVIRPVDGSNVAHRAPPRPRDRALSLAIARGSLAVRRSIATRWVSSGSGEVLRRGGGDACSPAIIATANGSGGTPVSSAQCGQITASSLTG